MTLNKITTVVFDLDGTLLDTLQDLTASVNYALLNYALPPRSLEDVRRFVGNGVRMLMTRAVNNKLEKNHFEACLNVFKEHYTQHSCCNTTPYPGIPQLLHELKNSSYQLAVLSNKFDPAVKELTARYFPNLFDVAVGEQEGVRSKPSPDMLYQVMNALDCTLDQIVYIGDSETDIAMAQKISIPCLSVTWGFRSEDTLRAYGATHLLHAPVDVSKWIFQH